MSASVKYSPSEIPNPKTDDAGRKGITSDIMKDAAEVTKVNAKVADAASVAGNARRMSNLRDKFEKGQEQKEAKPKKTKIRYAGVDSAKTKFIEDAERVINRPQKDDDSRKLKEITPPREGVVVGTLESEPKARLPGVFSSDDYPIDDFKAIGETTRNFREKFKKLEQIGATSFDDDDDSRGGEKRAVIEPATSEATKSAKAKWKDIESGKVESSVTKIKIDVGKDGPGGVYENDPDSLTDIARAELYRDSAHVIVTTSAAERRDAFLKKASGETAVKRLDPAAELLELARREKNTVYENTPTARPEDMVFATTQLDDFSNLSTAKSIREKFADPSKLMFEHSVKKTSIELTGEGGVYENEPQRRDDLVHYEDAMDDFPQDAVKWASTAKERFMKDAEERAKAIKRTEPVVIDNASGASTVYENEPTQSAADATALSNDEALVGAFASTAKQQFLQRQKEAEDASKMKSRPDIIDIWSELAPESGVFENTPAEHKEGIVVSGMYSDEEVDEDES